MLTSESKIFQVFLGTWQIVEPHGGSQVMTLISSSRTFTVIQRRWKRRQIGTVIRATRFGSICNTRCVTSWRIVLFWSTVGTSKRERLGLSEPLLRNPKYNCYHYPLKCYPVAFTKCPVFGWTFD